MKIVHIVNSYRSNGGVGNYVRRLTQAQSEAGHQIVVIHSDDQAEVQAGIKTHFIDAYDKYRMGMSESAHQLLKVLDDEQPELVHIHANENYPLEAIIRERYVTVKSIHVYEFCPSGSKFHHATGQVCEKKTGFLCLPRMVYKRCTLDKRPSTLQMFYSRSRDCIENDRAHQKVLVASDFVKEQAVMNGYDKDCVEVVPYFTDGPFATPKSSHEKIILYSGRVTKEKGVHLVLDALTYLPEHLDWKFVIDGDGAYLQTVKKLIEKRNLEDRVECVGWLDREAHHQMYADSRIVVVPSAWPEPFGLVGIEAMRYGKPVVGFGVGGILDWLRDGKTGFIASPGDTKAMATYLEQLLKDDILCQKMGENAIKVSHEEYSATKHLERIFSIYQAAIKSQKIGVQS